MSIDHESINKYLYGPYIGSEDTLIANIKKLSPGHFIGFNKDSSLSFSCHQYWSLVKKENYIKDKFNQFEEIFSKTINEHLTADVDIYSMYSGGLDSTLLINSSKKIKDNLKTVTINYNDTFSELEKLDIRNQIESLNINDINIKNDLYEIIDVFDDLSSSDGGFISNYYAAKHLNMKNIKAVTLGDGSDEIFGGYSWFNLGIFPLNFLPKKLISFLYFYSKSRINFNKYSKKTYENLNNTLDNNLNIFDQISFDEITNQLSNHYLMKVDKPFMKFSIEARVPFVDHKIVEFAYSLNKSQKLKYNNAFSNLLNSDSSKHFLRKIAQKNIFNDVHKKRKKGFSISYDDFVFKNKNDIAMSLDNLKNLKLINKDLSNLLIKKLPYFEKSKYNPYFKNIEMLSWKSHLLNIWFDKHISV